MVFADLFKVIFRYFEKVCGYIAINEDGQENIIPRSAHQKLSTDGLSPSLLMLPLDRVCLRDFHQSMAGQP